MFLAVFFLYDTLLCIRVLERSFVVICSLNVKVLGNISILGNLDKFVGFPMPEACNFIKKETSAKLYLSGFCQVFRNPFFIEDLSVDQLIGFYMMATLAFNELGEA